MQNNIEMIENMLNTERRNRRGNREIRFEVNSNYYEAVSKLLSDYKRVLKENEQKNKMIDLMAEDIYDSQIECNRYFRDKEEVKASFLLECLESEE